LNGDVGLQYLAAWLGGNGCVPIYNLMEDMATAEICRTQVWQWMRHGARMEDGQVVTSAAVSELVDEHVAKLNGRIPQAQLSTAVRLFEEIVNADSCHDFLSSRAYECID
jgi:malate synthase